MHTTHRKVKLSWHQHVKVLIYISHLSLSLFVPISDSVILQFNFSMNTKGCIVLRMTHISFLWLSMVITNTLEFCWEIAFLRDFHLRPLLKDLCTHTSAHTHIHTPQATLETWNMENPFFMEIATVNAQATMRTALQLNRHT